MAVAVPILLSATGASAAIGAAVGVSAGIVTAGAGLLVGATGIGKSINKAASKVFGEDLVNVANLAGGIALASGWNPGETWSSLAGSSSGGGALSSGVGAPAGGAQPAMDLSTSDIGVGGASAGGGAAQVVDQPASAMRLAERNSYSSDPNAAATRAAVDRGAVQASPGGALSRVLDKASEAWDKAGDRTKAALITTGGQALAGMAQGYETAKDRAEKRRRERIYQSGSGLTNTYGPRTSATSGG